eukprot:scaffold1702_cov253-Pinguiococcus_pyrenoidosus.AAC.2
MHVEHRKVENHRRRQLQRQRHFHLAVQSWLPRVVRHRQDLLRHEARPLLRVEDSRQRAATVLAAAGRDLQISKLHSHCKIPMAEARQGFRLHKDEVLVTALGIGLQRLLSSTRDIARQDLRDLPLFAEGVGEAEGLSIRGRCRCIHDGMCSRRRKRRLHWVRMGSVQSAPYDRGCLSLGTGIVDERKAHEFLRVRLQRVVVGRRRSRSRSGSRRRRRRRGARGSPLSATRRLGHVGIDCPERRNAVLVLWKVRRPPHFADAKLHREREVLVLDLCPVLNVHDLLHELNVGHARLRPVHHKIPNRRGSPGQVLFLLQRLSQLPVAVVHRRVGHSQGLEELPEALRVQAELLVVHAAASWHAIGILHLVRFALEHFEDLRHNDERRIPEGSRPRDHDAPRLDLGEVGGRRRLQSSGIRLGHFQRGCERLARKIRRRLREHVLHLGRKMLRLHVEHLGKLLHEGVGGHVKVQRLADAGGGLGEQRLAVLLHAEVDVVQRQGHEEGFKLRRLEVHAGELDREPLVADGALLQQHLERLQAPQLVSHLGIGAEVGMVVAQEPFGRSSVARAEDGMLGWPAGVSRQLLLVEHGRRLGSLCLLVNWRAGAPKRRQIRVVREGGGADGRGHFGEPAAGVQVMLQEGQGAAELLQSGEHSRRDLPVHVPSTGVARDFAVHLGRVHRVGQLPLSVHVLQRDAFLRQREAALAGEVLADSAVGHGAPEYCNGLTADGPSSAPSSPGPTRTRQPRLPLQAPGRFWPNNLLVFGAREAVRSSFGAVAFVNASAGKGKGEGNKRVERGVKLFKLNRDTFWIPILVSLAPRPVSFEPLPAAAIPFLSHRRHPTAVLELRTGFLAFSPSHARRLCTVSILPRKDWVFPPTAQGLWAETQLSQTSLWPQTTHASERLTKSFWPPWAAPSPSLSQARKSLCARRQTLRWVSRRFPRRPRKDSTSRGPESHVVSS